MKTHIRILILVGLIFLLTPGTKALTLTIPATGVADTGSKVTAAQILDEAYKHLGKPYRWGGKGPSSFDCAGFVRYVYGQFGFNLAPSCTPQYKQGTPLSEGELQPGDLVYFGGRRKSRSLGHVGIVVTTNPDGTFDFIHAARTGVRISHSSEPYYDMRFVCACRILHGGFTLPENYNEYDPDNLEQYFEDNDHIYAIMRGTDITNKLSAQLVELEPEPMPDTLELAFVGSIQMRSCDLLGRMSCKSLPSDDLENVLRQADIAVGVLDGPLNNTGWGPIRALGSKYRHQMSTGCAMNLLYSSIDIVSLSSGHAMDLGIEGLGTTMNALDSVGIRYSGIKEICQTATVEKDGYNYGYCSFGSTSECPNYMDSHAMKTLIQSMRDTVDILIVTIVPAPASHILDSTSYKNTLQRCARTAIDYGADAVVCCYDGAELDSEEYSNRVIVYGLGSFCGKDIHDAPAVQIHLLSTGDLIDAAKFTLPPDNEYKPINN